MASDDFARSFDDVITEDVLVIMLGLGGVLELKLFCDLIGPKKLKLRADLEEQLKRWRNVTSRPGLKEKASWRDLASRPGLKGKAEQIIFEKVLLLASGYPVNGLIRLAIADWCAKHLESKAGAPELRVIEIVHRLNTVERIIKENSGAKAKLVVTKIMRELGLKERSAKSLKQMVEGVEPQRAGSRRK